MNKALKITLWVLTYLVSAACMLFSYPLFLFMIGPIIFICDGLILAAIAALSLVYLRRRSCRNGLLFTLSLPPLLFALQLLLLATNIIHVG